MRASRSDGQQTRARLLQAAAQLFARKGFRVTTVAEICQRAQANSAAVNYHFQSKSGLYAAAWREAFEHSIARYPPGNGVPDSASPEERLHGYIFSILARLADPESLEFDIADKELASPTGLLREVMDLCIDPLRVSLKQIVRDLLGTEASEQVIDLCVMSVKAQTFGPLRRERHIRMKHAGDPPVFPSHIPAVELSVLASHITDFSLAGIAAIRTELHGSHHIIGASQ